ncbi:MAG: M24 family metallopeptidase [Maritimibacter harenae]
MKPARGFPDSTFATRVALAQERMEAAGIEALLLTTPADVAYVTGFLTRFWESPTRPWYVVVPATGAPIAVIPEIGVPLMARTWIEDIRSWPSPDYTDDGVTHLAGTLAEVVGAGGTIGVPSGHETHLRMPLADWRMLRDRLSDRVFSDDAGILRALRMVKSDAEIDKIRWAAGLPAGTFDRMDEIAAAGVALSEVFRSFEIACLRDGADRVPYLAGAAGPDGYEDVISPATDTALAEGDVLMLDTGAVWDGYFCDYDRNYVLGTPSRRVADAHRRLIDATQAGFDAARPGATPAELFAAMDFVLTGGHGTGAGRLGHGVGLSLTEPPSILPADHTPLVPGMVLSLEPVIETVPGRIMVHEEMIVITPDGADWITAPIGHDLLRLDG